MNSYGNTVPMHLSPLPVVFVHFQFTIPAYAGFGAKVTFETAQATHKCKELTNLNFEDIEASVTCESCFRLVTL